MAEEEEEPREQISAEDAEAVLEANYANIVSKVSSGKTLSQSEHRLLMEIREGRRPKPRVFAKNQVELARHLEVNRKTIQRWLKQKGNPGSKSDGRFDVEAWRDWRNGRSEADSNILDKADLERRRLTKVNALLDLDIRERNRELVDRAKFESWIVAVTEKQKAMLRVMLKNQLPPRLAGMDAAEIAAQMDDIIEQVCAAMQRLEI